MEPNSLSFSQRLGLSKIRKVMQVDSIDNALRNSLWNAIEVCVWMHARENYLLRSEANRIVGHFARSIWVSFLKLPLDEMPQSIRTLHKAMKAQYAGMPWFRVYDLIEFSATYGFETDAQSKEFIGLCNGFMEAEMSGHRFINGRVAPITDPVEIQEIERAAESNASPVRSHILRAIELLGQRPAGDFRNSIKESISAVESACSIVSAHDNADLSKALEIVHSKHPMHGAFKTALKSLYGWTSDDDGIRHKILDEPNVDFADAKFMLVVCSAFCNFLLMRSE